MTPRALLAAIPLLLAATSPAAEETHVALVKTSDAPVIAELGAGFKSAFPGATLDEVLVGDDTLDLARKLGNAQAILAVGPKAATLVMRAKPAAPTIACVPPTLADPATQGPTLRLQPPVDGILATVEWLGTYKKIGFIADASQKERIELAKVAASSHGQTLSLAAVSTPRDVVTAVQTLLGKIDLLVIDVTDGLSIQDVQFILKSAGDQKVPVLGTSEGFLRAGAPAAVAIDPRNVGAEAGRLASAHAAGLFDPRRFRVMLNLVATQRLGMNPPQDRGIVDNNILTLDTDGSDLKGAPVPAVTSNETRPTVAKRGRLVFPAAAMNTGVRQAEVVVEVTVKANGSMGDTRVLKGSYFVLDALGDTMTAFGNTYLRVEGNTDSTGSQAVNKDLSQRRADSVKAYLVKNFPSIQPQRFQTIGHGANNPVAPNSTEAGRQMNRRTDIKVILATQ